MGEARKWNQPSTGHSAKGGAATQPARRRVALCVLLGAAVLSAGVAAWFYLRGDGVDNGQDNPTAPTRPAMIDEVKPAKPAKAAEAKKPEPPDPKARPTKVGEVVNGYVLLPSGRMHRRTGVVTNSAAMRPKGKHAIFARSCNNEIAAYLTINPGDTLVGTPRYNGRFVKDFLESIKEPIVISNEDTPEQAELKRAVIAARIDLKDAYDRGEDIEQIMLDTRAEIQGLMRYKQDLTQEFNRLRKEEGMTERDVETLFDACNRMLESKGISPLKFGPITRRRMLSNIREQSSHE